ncbi:hypothetical protein DFJ58DRAFT_789383 [Suillus subalutaceus]|uniref:uncharacterized protein n=1 Tax=Suillus subalutaceus TaxID=48586 RepID=UPI001B861D32|nr:uncharacterized protein DFJ58DRAFT_789383 [Suillus subalutaceus]KAG1853740.1 hypothetical protein DFJ58DRAFT_789383 [Suillus subalutaceus]
MPAAKTNKPAKPKVKRYHVYAVILFVMGTLFPPLGRFGIGKDFWLNLLLTICGYIPGHVHNFYIQNVRNNKNHRRTPKWVERYGLVDTSTIKRHEQRSQWAGRYNDRNPNSALDDQPLEEGQASPSRSTTQDSSTKPTNGSALWKADDESFYNPGREGSMRSAESGSSRWRYPANFNDIVPEGDAPARKKKKKKDRWARTEDAYTAPEQKKRKKKSKNRSTTGDDGDLESTYSRRAESSVDLEVPEDAGGGTYGSGRQGNGDAAVENDHAAALQGESDVFNHEF